MSDETELNIELTEQQSKIESALLGIELSAPAIDQDTLMYRAGWAAAMDEVSNAKPRRDTTASKDTTGIWPALTMTFAATTAACLLFIWLPTGSETQIARQEGAVAIAKECAEQSHPVLTQNRSNSDHEAEVVRSVDVPRTGLLRSLLGFSTDRIVGQRDVQIKQYIAEAASPSQVSIALTDADWDSEPSIPLTPRSKFVF